MRSWLILAERDQCLHTNAARNAPRCWRINAVAAVAAVHGFSEGDSLLVRAR